jgi:hypothetical protein
VLCYAQTDENERIVYLGDVRVNLRERMAGIDTNLDDVQAGAEATSRAADTLIADTVKFNGQLKGSLLRAVARHVMELRECAADQRNALEELRRSLARLRLELRLAQRQAIRPPPLAILDSKLR